ncbi:MAG: hypothetical protein RLZZ540_43 [Bacteroidota bacterium]|jgi:hypothetical protein
MKKLLLALAFITLGITSNNAQTAPTPTKYDKVANSEVAKLDALLKIISNQKAKLFALEIDRQTRRGEMKELGDTATEEQKASLKQWYKDYPARLKAILTPEQYDILAEEKAKEKAAAK